MGFSSEEHAGRCHKLGSAIPWQRDTSFLRRGRIVVHSFPLLLLYFYSFSYRFSTLERNGTARRIAAGYDLETVESFPDEEIGAALSSLEKATLVITEQTLILKLQRTALSEFQAGYRQTQIQSKRTAGLRQRNRLQEKQNIDLAVTSTKNLFGT